MGSRLDKVKDWHKAAAGADYRVAFLAERCGVTERQLRRYFRRRFGLAPHLWMSRKRLEGLKWLLSQGALVKQAAAYGGFNHQGNFSRKFKRYFKMTPGHYKAGKPRADLNFFRRIPDVRF